MVDTSQFTKRFQADVTNVVVLQDELTLGMRTLSVLNKVSVHMREWTSTL